LNKHLELHFHLLILFNMIAITNRIVRSVSLHFFMVFLAVTVGSSAAMAAENLLENGDFQSSDLKPWFFYQDGTVTAKATAAAENGVLTISGLSLTEKPFHRQLIHKLVPVQSGQKYLLQFSTKLEGATAADKEILINLTRSIDYSKPHYGLWRKIAPTPEWQEHKLYFTVKDLDPKDPPALKFSIGSLDGTLSLKECILRPVVDPSKQPSQPVSYN
jgi:hypothetical protein